MLFNVKDVVTIGIIGLEVLGLTAAYKYLVEKPILDAVYAKYGTYDPEEALKAMIAEENESK